MTAPRSTERASPTDMEGFDGRLAAQGGGTDPDLLPRRRVSASDLVQRLNCRAGEDRLEVVLHGVLRDVEFGGELAGVGPAGPEPPDESPSPEFVELSDRLDQIERHISQLARQVDQIGKGPAQEGSGLGDRLAEIEAELARLGGQVDELGPPRRKL
jgi:hypothetical protein